MDKKKLKEAFDAGRNYEADLNKYSGKPIHRGTESFTKWYNRQVKNCLIADVVKPLPTDDAKFIYSLLPEWAKDAPKGLNPMMYGTLTQEGDQKVIDRVKGILGNV